jgi:hypothetical protein
MARPRKYSEEPRRRREPGVGEAPTTAGSSLIIKGMTDETLRWQTARFLELASGTPRTPGGSPA